MPRSTIAVPPSQGEKRCWICLEDEIESAEDSLGPFINICSCTLQAHEGCLLQWMLASRKTTPSCPQCGTKFVAVKKRQVFGYIVLGFRRLMAAAAFCGVSFIVFRSIGSLYIRAVYAPSDADRILGVLPIPGVTSLTNKLLKLINSLLVAGIPYVLLRRPRIGIGLPQPGPVEPPLLSLAMILVSRVEPQPTGWTSLMVAGLAHSTYRFAMDTFVMPRLAKAPIQVSEVPELPMVLNLNRDEEDEELEEEIRRLRVREPALREGVRQGGIHLTSLVENSDQVSEFLVLLTCTVVRRIVDDYKQNYQDAGASTDNDEPLLQNRSGTPNDSDATNSDVEELDEAAILGMEEHGFRIRGLNPVSINGQVVVPLDDPDLPESFVRALFFIVNSDRSLDNYDEWSNDFSDKVRDLVNKMISAGEGFNLQEEATGVMWELTYWQPIKFLELTPVMERRTALLKQAGEGALNSLKDISSLDAHSWNSADYEHLLLAGTLEGTAEYISHWIDFRLRRFLDPFHQVFMDEVMNGIAQAEAVAAMDPEVEQEYEQGIQRPIDPSLEWEQALPVLLYPLASMAMSSMIKPAWPFSSISIMNRNLVAGGFVIVANDMLKIAVSTIQNWARNDWYITRLDDLDEETQQTIQMQQNIHPDLL